VLARKTAAMDNAILWAMLWAANPRWRRALRNFEDFVQMVTVRLLNRSAK